MRELMYGRMLEIIENDIKEGKFDELDKCGFYDNEMYLNICDELDVDIDDYERYIENYLKKEFEYIIEMNGFWEE